MVAAYFVGDGSRLTGISGGGSGSGHWTKTAGTNELSYTAGSVGISNANPIHDLSVGSNLYVDDDATDGILRVTGNVVATHFVGDGSRLINLPAGGGSTNWTTLGNPVNKIYYPQNPGITSVSVGIMNAAPQHTLSVGSNLFIDDTASNVLVVDGDISAESMFLGALGIKPSYPLDTVTEVGNVTPHTISFTNPTLSITTASNVEIGGALVVGKGTLGGSNLEVGEANLFVNTDLTRVGIGTDQPEATLHVNGDLSVGGVINMGIINVVAQHSLEAVTATGNTTPLTIELQNADTSLVTTGNVEVGGELNVSGNVTVSSNLTVSGNVSDLNVVSNVNMLHTSNTASIKLNSNVVAEFPRSKKLIKYPRVALGTNASPYSGLGSGSTVSGYTIKASGEYDLNLLASKAFTGTNDANEVDAWLSSSAVYSSNTPVANSATLTKFGQQGSWLEIKLPNKIKLSSTRIFSRRRHITERNDTADIWASNTGTDGDWVKLATINFNNTYTDTIPMVADIDTPTYYQYFAIQITRINWSGTYANIGEWELFGTPEYDPEAHGTDVTVKSVANVPNTDWLEVYYDAKNYSGSGDVPDETTNNRDGVVTGATLDETGGIESFAFNGVNQTITLSDVGISGGQALSMSGWLKVNSAGEVARMGIGTYTAARCMYFTVDNSVSAYYIVCNAHNNVYTGTFSPNTWIHVNMVYTGAAYLGGYISGTTLLLYINGKLQTPLTPAAGTTPLNLPSPCPLRLGRGIDGGYTAGSIANFRLFNRALTSDEIYRLYAYQKEYFGHGDLSMTLKAGRLGIGTSEPRAALDVRGSVIVNGGGVPIIYDTGSWTSGTSIELGTIQWEKYKYHRITCRFFGTDAPPGKSGWFNVRIRGKKVGQSAYSGINTYESFASAIKKTSSTTLTSIYNGADGPLAIYRSDPKTVNNGDCFLIIDIANTLNGRQQVQFTSSYTWATVGYVQVIGGFHNYTNGTASYEKIKLLFEQYSSTSTVGSSSGDWTITGYT